MPKWKTLFSLLSSMCHLQKIASSCNLFNTNALIVIWVSIIPYLTHCVYRYNWHSTYIWHLWFEMTTQGKCKTSHLFSTRYITWKKYEFSLDVVKEPFSLQSSMCYLLKIASDFNLCNTNASVIWVSVPYLTHCV